MIQWKLVENTIVDYDNPNETRWFSPNTTRCFVAVISTPRFQASMFIWTNLPSPMLLPKETVNKTHPLIENQRWFHLDSVEIIKKSPRTDSIHNHSWQPRDVSPSHASSDPRVFDLEMFKFWGWNPPEKIEQLWKIHSELHPGNLTLAPKKRPPSKRKVVLPTKIFQGLC